MDDSDISWIDTSINMQPNWASTFVGGLLVLTHQLI